MAVLRGVILLLCVCICQASELSKKVLLISMDGFRWDYLKMVPETPNIKEMARNGVQLDYVNNTFITKTFPTHYAIVTGLWEESHGIIGNSMYDPVFNETFRLGNNDNKWWNEGEPVWITAKKQFLKTGTYYWPGSEVEIQGLRPDIWLHYNKSVPFDQRVNTVVQWFKDDVVDLATLYFYEPDSTGHSYGPFSEEVKDKVREMDGVLGDLINGLKAAGVFDKINIILTSDHGMTSVNRTTRMIYIEDYVNAGDIRMIPEGGPVANILPVEGREDAVYQALRNAHPNMTVYKKADIPEHFHYKNNRRVMPVLAIADDGWMIEYNVSSLGRWNPRGNHGYDNRLLDMRPIFVAQGPNFKKNFKMNSINSVDIYPMICELLGITPAPHNGTMENVAPLLQLPGTVNGTEEGKVTDFPGSVTGTEEGGVTDGSLNGAKKGEVTLMTLIMAMIRHLSAM